MTLERINNITQISKELVWKANKLYKSNARSSVAYEQVIGFIKEIPNKLFLIHKNMIFERNSISDSSYEVWSFDENGKQEKEDIEKLGGAFFRDFKVIKSI